MSDITRPEGMPPQLEWARYELEGGNLRVDITRMVDSSTKELRHVMCCICFEYTCLKCLWIDGDGFKWDMCKSCGERENAMATCKKSGCGRSLPCSVHGRKYEKSSSGTDSGSYDSGSWSSSSDSSSSSSDSGGSCGGGD